jgi:hypothetical protein
MERSEPTASPAPRAPARRRPRVAARSAGGVGWRHLRIVVTMRILAIALTAVPIVPGLVAILGAFAVPAGRLLGLRFGLMLLLRPDR